MPQDQDVEQADLQRRSLHAAQQSETKTWIRKTNGYAKTLTTLFCVVSTIALLITYLQQANFNDKLPCCALVMDKEPCRIGGPCDKPQPIIACDLLEQYEPVPCDNDTLVYSKLKCDQENFFGNPNDCIDICSSSNKTIPANGIILTNMPDMPRESTLALCPTKLDDFLGRQKSNTTTKSFKKTLRTLGQRVNITNLFFPSWLKGRYSSSYDQCIFRDVIGVLYSYIKGK